MALAPSMPLAPSAPLAPWTTGSRRRPSTPAILNICNQPARSDRSQQDFGFHKIRFIATRVRTAGVESGQEPREVRRRVTTGWRRPRWSPRLQVVQVVQVQVEQMVQVVQVVHVVQVEQVVQVVTRGL